MRVIQGAPHAGNSFA